jgi:NADH:ubiquinone oxidoreductase subunit 3 (subunit A)
MKSSKQKKNYTIYNSGSEERNKEHLQINLKYIVKAP